MADKNIINDEELDSVAGGIGGNVTMYSEGGDIDGTVIDKSKTSIDQSSKIGGDYTGGSKIGGDYTGGSKVTTQTKVDVGVNVKKSLF